jgi:hypothetical protein
MANPDFRALCAELVNVLDNLNHFPTSRLPSSKIAGLVDRTRTELSQPTPEPVARMFYPTDKHRVTPASPIARTFAELSKEEAADNPYWVEGEPLYTAPLAQSVPEPPTGWKEATIAQEVCASIHREYVEGKDPWVILTTHIEDLDAIADRAALSQPTPEPPMDKQWEDEALNAYRTASIDPGTSTHLRWGQGNG